MKWVKKSIEIGQHPIPAKSSVPKTFRKPTHTGLADKICEMRIKTRRCTEAIHLELQREGVKIGKSTIHRILCKSFLLKKKSPWKRYHPPVERPRALSPGDLVQMDTIHLMVSEKKRKYVVTLIDTYSRWVHAKCYEKMNAATAVLFLKQTTKLAPFQFHMIQTDHGSEFGSWFVSMIKKHHRFTRISKPNDNAHIERFNRTIQEECLDLVEQDVSKINRTLKKYLSYYNNQRIHLGINLYPIEMVVPRC